MIIYKITNTVNDRVYIGQTTGRISKRWTEHSTSKKNSPLYNAFRKYGKKKFKIEVICTALHESHLNELERYFILYYNAMSPVGYNLTSGGDSAYTRSEESRQKQRTAMLGRIPSEETKLKISKTLMGHPSPRKGVTLSVETKAKISLAQIGRIASDETKERMRAATSGDKAYNAKKVLCVETGMVYGSTGEAARELELDQSSVSAVCRGKRKQTGGFTFVFKLAA